MPSAPAPHRCTRSRTRTCARRMPGPASQRARARAAPPMPSRTRHMLITPTCAAPRPSQRTMATESYKQMISECLIQYTKQPKGASTRVIENFLKRKKSLTSRSRPAMKKALANGLESLRGVRARQRG